MGHCNPQLVLIHFVYHGIGRESDVCVTYQNMLSVKRYSYVLPCTGHIKYVILIIAQQLIARRYVSISSI